MYAYCNYEKDLKAATPSLLIRRSPDCQAQVCVYVAFMWLIRGNKSLDEGADGIFILCSTQMIVCW
jgi:hypothetical protein